MADRRIVLSETKDGNGVSARWVRLTNDGDLLIEGHDLGPGVQLFFGGNEYEFVRTVRAADMPALRRAFQLDEEDDLLAALLERYDGRGTSELEQFIQDAGVPSEFWSRVGD